MGKMINFELEKKKDEIRGKALRKLSFSMRTENEIREFLKENYDDKELIEDTISFLKEFNYLNDVSYSVSFFKREKLKMKSKKRIISELKTKGVKESDIESAVELMENSSEEKAEEDIETAKKIMNKMVNEQKNAGKSLDDKFKGKLMRRLISKGYDNSICYKILSEVKKDE